MKSRLLPLAALAIIFQNAIAQNTSTYDSYVPLRYFQTSLTLIKTTTGFTPPVASRALGYMGLGLYESVVPGMPDYQSADGILGGLGPGAVTDPSGSLHYPTAANNALAFLVDSLFQNMSAGNRTALYALRDSFNAVFSGNPNYANSKTFGEAVGLDIFNFSKTDGAHQGYLKNFPPSYTPPTGYGLWVPTPPAFQSIPLQPYWGSNRVYVPENSGALVPGTHPTFDTLVGSAFYTYADEVYQTKLNLTAAQQNIANFWADGGGTVTPPGHSISLLNQFIISENENLEAAAIAYGKMGMAVSDAFVNCWKTKYIYNLMRPVTYIRQYIAPSFTSYIGTPPFPEYTSGHSTQSGAMCAVMTALYGPNRSFTDNTHGASFGGPRSFSSFEEAATEAAVSRLYGGIHYSFSNEQGVDIGKNVGNNINELFATQLRVNPQDNAALDLTIDKTQAEIGDTVEITIYLLNVGLTEIHDIEVQNTLPTNLQFLSAAPETGTYNSGTGIWAVDSIAAGDPVVTLVLRATVSGDGVPYFLSEIVAMQETDANSTPNNHVLTEDDIESVCLSVPVEMCQPNLDLSAPDGYTAYEWFQSTDNGATFNSIATTQNITVTEAGQYLFTVDGGTLGSCGNQLCCPVIVFENCCPVKVCMPIRVTRK